MGESAMPFADAFPLPKWPYLNLGNLERVEHVHCDRVSSLVRQMPTDATPQTLERLPGIDRLAVVVVERHPGAVQPDVGDPALGGLLAESDRNALPG